MHLHCWRAPLVLMDPPLRSYAVREPMMEFRERQLCWLHVLANLRTLVALLHWLVGWAGPVWREPPGTLASALQDVGRQARCNAVYLRASCWLAVEPEPHCAGRVAVQPVD